jgi:hypothetical protein
MSVLRSLTLAFALLVPGTIAFADDLTLEQVLIESANTPAQHQALADHFRSRAAGARHQAQRHRSMAKSYTGGRAAPSPVAGYQSSHCNKLATTFDEQAKEYDALAELHAKEAAK